MKKRKKRGERVVSLEIKWVSQFWAQITPACIGWTLQNEGLLLISKLVAILLPWGLYRDASLKKKNPLKLVQRARHKGGMRGSFFSAACEGERCTQ